MKKNRILVILLVLLFATSLFAEGQKEASSTELWPKTQPVVYVGFGAGGGTDTAVRPVIAKMEEYLGETINVVNQEGAASAVAANTVMYSKKHDGYSMFATGSGPISGFRVMGTSDTYWADWASFHPYMGAAALVVAADSDIETYADAVAYLKSGKQNMAISGFGVGPHVLFEAIRDIAGVPAPNYMTAGSCRQAGINVIAGDAEIAMGTFSSLIDFIKAGQLRALAITDTKDYTDFGLNIPSIMKVQENAENIPLLSETWPLLIPRDVPQNILDGLTEAFNWAVQQPEIVDYAREQGLVLAGYAGEDADRFLAIQEAGYAWTLHNVGSTVKSPAEFDIPKLADFDWAVAKRNIK
ncbi:MAG: tripartite tricarboxylate transporter substrate-binding protein [Sphaerochaetaceae bacterium]